MLLLGHAMQQRVNNKLHPTNNSFNVLMRAQIMKIRESFNKKYI